MGIWSDIAGGIGQIGVQLGTEYIRSRYTPQPDIIYPGGGGGGYYPPAGGPPAMQIPTGSIPFAGTVPDYTQPASYIEPTIPIGQTPLLPETIGGAGGMACAQYFRPTSGAAYHPMKFLVQPHPRTGALKFWQYVGSPDHFTGYKGIVKAERRLASKAVGRTQRRRGRKR